MIVEFKRNEWNQELCEATLELYQTYAEDYSARDFRRNHRTGCDDCGMVAENNLKYPAPRGPEYGQKWYGYFKKSLSEISIGMYNWPFYSFSVNIHWQTKGARIILTLLLTDYHQTNWNLWNYCCCRFFPIILATTPAMIAINIDIMLFTIAICFRLSMKYSIGSAASLILNAGIRKQIQK